MRAGSGLVVCFYHIQIFSSGQNSLGLPFEKRRYLGDRLDFEWGMNYILVTDGVSLVPVEILHGLLGVDLLALVDNHKLVKLILNNPVVNPFAQHFQKRENRLMQLKIKYLQDLLVRSGHQKLVQASLNLPPFLRLQFFDQNILTLKYLTSALNIKPDFLQVKISLFKLCIQHIYHQNIFSFHEPQRIAKCLADQPKFKIRMALDKNLHPIMILAYRKYFHQHLRERLVENKRRRVHSIMVSA